MDRKMGAALIHQYRPPSPGSRGEHSLLLAFVSQGGDRLVSAPEEKSSEEGEAHAIAFVSLQRKMTLLSTTRPV